MNVVRLRLMVLAGIAVTLGAGLGFTAIGFGEVGGYAGDVLYACLIALLILLLLPRTRPVPLLAAATAVCWAVEFFQLTPWPARWAEHSLLARLVFGTTFNAPDLPAYAAGAALVAVLLARIPHVRESRKTREGRIFGAEEEGSPEPDRSSLP